MSVGGTIGPTGAAAVWTKGRVYLFEPGLSNVRVVCAGLIGAPLAVGFRDQEGGSQILDGSGALITARSGGACSRKRLPPFGPGTISSAAYRRARWTLLVMQPPGSDRPPTILQQENGRWRSLLPPWPQMEPSAYRWLYLSETGAGLIVGTAWPPYWWMRLIDREEGDTAPAPWVSNSVGGLLLALSQARVAGEWVGLRVVATRDGFLQTIADLKSEARVLVRFDRHGRVVRLAQLGVPFGVVASRRDVGLVLAIAALNHPTVMMYRLTGGL